MAKQALIYFEWRDTKNQREKAIFTPSLIYTTNFVFVSAFVSVTFCDCLKTYRAACET